jgi:hypothetical protein
MACFIAPTATTIIATAIRKKIPEKYHINWLIMMFFGGSVMLIVDHIANGEIISTPPFLTALKAPGYMLKEILTTGLAMTIAIFIAWGIMVSIVSTLSSFKKSPVIS